MLLQLLAMVTLWKRGKVEFLFCNLVSLSLFKNYYDYAVTQNFIYSLILGRIMKI